MGTHLRCSYGRISKTSRLGQGCVHRCVNGLKSLPGAERPGETYISLGVNGQLSWRWLKSQSSLQGPGHHPPDVGAFPPIPAGLLNVGHIGKLRLVF
uniref:Uncharacterized protein n=1 Tax=Aotus nancymaae TaxID=37293 RepID=A0A2K5DVH8_AOTNA